MFEWWWKFLYNVVYSINRCIDGFYKLFLFLAGAAPADVNQEISGDSDTNILVRIFTDNSVSVLFIGFLGFAALIFMVSIIIGLVRSEWSSKDNSEGKLKVLKQSLKGFLLVFLIPTIFSIGIWATSILLSSIISGMSGTSISDLSLAQKIFEICLPDNSSSVPLWPKWTDGYGNLSAWGWDMHDYNYFLGILGGIIILFIIGLAALNLVERIIDLVFLYLTAPFVIAVSPLDEGNRLGIWKDLVISKLLSVAGMLLCFYIYFLCLPIVDQLFARDTFIVRLGYLIFAIGGALAARKGGLLISNLVGHNTALIEGQQAGQTAQIVGTGFRAGLQVTTGLLGGALHLLGSAGGGLGNLLPNGGGNSAANGGGNSAANGGGNNGLAVSNILQNNAETSFSGIQAAGNVSQVSVPYGGASGTPVPSLPPSVPAGGSMANATTSMPQIINSGQGFGGISTPDIPASGEPTAARNVPRVEMPVDSDIRNAINGNGFSGSGNNGENK